MDSISDHNVGVVTHCNPYDQVPPYGPGSPPPEYPFADSSTTSHSGTAYEAVRDVFRLLKLDAANQGTVQWNPLGQWVRPGVTVVLKPNFVRDFRETAVDHGNCLLTHGSLIRAVADFVFIALEGRGRIIVADAPQNDADFSAIRKIAGLDELQVFYHRYAGFDLEVYDLRRRAADKVDGVIVGHRDLSGDPAGYVAVNLGSGSSFSEINDLCHLLFGAEYDTDELHRHQSGDTHEYLIAGTILDADVVISLPKFKTHKKVGITLNLKNAVGITGNKNWLPHHREGTPASGGDQFPDDAFAHRLERFTMARFRRWFPYLGPLRRYLAGPLKQVGKQLFGDTNRGKIRSGNWYGNDTAWRMAIDLNRILLYADRQGNMSSGQQRRFFSVADGIVAGEGNGPLDATPKSAGVLLAGGNPVAVDAVGARLMGFDRSRLPIIHRAFIEHTHPLANFESSRIHIHCDDDRFDGFIDDMEGAALDFRPHDGWVGHVEIQERAVT